MNNQVESNINTLRSHSEAHTLHPNVIVKTPGTPYPKIQAENSVKSDNNPSHSINAFVDELVEGEEILF